MAIEAAKNGPTIAVWVLRATLGSLFLAIGGAKLAGVWQTVRLFAAIGWGQWFRYATGMLDVAGALLLFVPRLISALAAATLAWLTRPHRVS